MPESSLFRSGYVAIVGLPNVGKSTLLNCLLGHHLAAVAPRPQTTRHKLLGILNLPNCQAIFLDTPGLLDPKYALQRLMKQEIESAVKDADLLLTVIDGTADPDSIEPVLSLVSNRPTVVAINKVDLVPDKTVLLQFAARLNTAGLDKVLMVSALKGQGITELKSAIVDALPEGKPYYPTDQLADRPERFFCAEFIREAIFNLYGEEIPYSTAVVVEEFKEQPGRKDLIRATIYVERDSQKAILIGRNGVALKRVGQHARRAIEGFLGRGVYLELWVKVARDWRNNESFIRQNVFGRG
ncbi:MAG: GTPase Era [candidate division WOR-3 bacterium]